MHTYVDLIEGARCCLQSIMKYLVDEKTAPKNEAVYDTNTTWIIGLESDIRTLVDLTWLRLTLLRRSSQ